jgi:tripartite-type tricarboxylate transporter receptor subunit TctC
MPAALGHVQSGKLKALAVPSQQRIAALPDVPTMPEAGLPDFIASSWGALLAPAGVSPEIAQKIAADSATALRSPEMRERLAALGAEPVGLGPDEARRFVAAEVTRWTRIAENAKIEKQ